MFFVKYVFYFTREVDNNYIKDARYGEIWPGFKRVVSNLKSPVVLAKLFVSQDLMTFVR